MERFTLPQNRQPAERELRGQRVSRHWVWRAMISQRVGGLKIP